MATKTTPEYYEGLTYRLRAGSPIYDDNGNAYLHTFGSETNRVLIYECITGADLPSSDDFMGQGGYLASASFSKIGDREDHLQGRVIYEPRFGSESVPTSFFRGTVKDNSYGNEEIVFIECSSLNVSYDIMGLVTVSYTVVSNTPGIKFFYYVSTGDNGKSFSGFPTNISYNIIPGTNWYETHVTLMAVTTGSRFTNSNNESFSSGEVKYPDWWYKKGE